jgi:hypothetical protein
MLKVALIIYSKATDAGHSAIYRALMFAQELTRSGDDAVIVFDGAGTTSLADMLNENSDLHSLFEQTRPCIRGACQFCAKAYGVLDQIEGARLPLLTDDRGHASLRELLREGRQLVTF